MMIKRELMLIEAQNICGFYNEKKEDLNCLPIKAQWAILSGVKKLVPVVSEFEEFRNKLVNDLQTTFFDEEHSKETQIPVTDEDGNNVLDENGEVQMQEGRAVKPEYMDEYNEKVASLNQEIQKLLIEKTEYEFKAIDLDDIIDGLDDDCPLTLNDLDMISFCDINSANPEGE